jgi:predicted ArsR family transcriptional regulator
MNQTLIEAIKEVEALPDAEQEELGRELMRLAARKRIDAMLAASQARGGATPHEEFMDELLKDLRA